MEFLIGNVRGMGHIKEEVLVCENNITQKEFMHDYITKYQPCVFQQIILDWPAIQNWNNPEYLSKKLGDDVIYAEKRPIKDQFREIGKNWRKVFMSYGDY